MLIRTLAQITELKRTSSRGAGGEGVQPVRFEGLAGIIRMQLGKRPSEELSSSCSLHLIGGPAEAIQAQASLHRAGTRTGVPPEPERHRLQGLRLWTGSQLVAREEQPGETWQPRSP